MWLVLLGVLGIGGLLLWQRSAHGAFGKPTLPAVFTNLAPNQLYLLNVFTTNPPPPTSPPDLSVSLITFLASAMPVKGVGKIAQVAQRGVNPSALPPEVPRPSPGTTLTQWGVPVMATAAVQLPRALTMNGTSVFVINALLIMGSAAPVKGEG
jgi:hypothetical protein